MINDIKNEFSSDNSFLGGTSISGGKLHGGKEEEITIYYSPDNYCKDKNPDIGKFMSINERQFSDPYPASIFIVPNDYKTKWNKYIKDLEDKNIAPGSVEAIEEAIKGPYGFGDYVFDVYDRETKDNDGFPYQPPEDFPKGKSTILRRVNRSNQIYYIKLDGTKGCQIANNDKMTGANDLKFLALCRKKVILFQGDLPKSKDTIAEK